MEKIIPSIDSKEFKIWKEWFIKTEPESASCFNDEDIYDIFKLNEQN